VFRRRRSAADAHRTACRRGDYLCWRGDDALGVVLEVSVFDVEIKWSDGDITRSFFDDMMKGLILTDINRHPILR